MQIEGYQLRYKKEEAFKWPVSSLDHFGKYCEFSLELYILSRGLAVPVH
jgi:hypothetical protein